MKLFFYLQILIFLSGCCLNRENEQSELAPEPWILVKNYDQVSKYPPLGYTSGYVNLQGDTVIPLDQYPRCFTDTFTYYAIVLDNKRGLIGINRQGKKLFTAVWSGDAEPIPASDGMILITENEKYGYANSKGEIVIPPKYSCASSFDQGKAKVSNDCIEINEEHQKWKVHSWFYIDKTGKRIHSSF